MQVAMASGFWKKFWDNYCDVTHFHGFRELQMYNNWWNRGFWVVSILGGFGFTAMLMVLGVQTYLSNQVSTLVTFNKSGILDTKVMYCPDEWIDSSKLSKYSGPNIEIQLNYAMYFLSQLKTQSTGNILALVDPVYQNYAFNTGSVLSEIHKRHIINWVADLVWDESIPLPAYYSPIAAAIMQDIRRHVYGSLAEEKLIKEYYGSSSPLQQFYVSLFKLLWCNQTEELFQSVYDFLLIDKRNEIVRAAYSNTLMIYGEMKNGNKYRGNRFGCFSLKILDDLQRQDQSKSQNELEEDILNKTNCDGLINGANEQLGTLSTCVSDQRLALLIAFNDFFTRPMIDGSTFEKYRARKVLSILHEYQEYRSYQERFPSISMIDYLYSEPDALNKMKQMLFNAEKRFVKELDDNFTAFLRDNNFSRATDFLKDIAVDESKYVFWLSLSRAGTLAPYKPNIDTKKVVTKDGVCLQFHLTAQPSDWPPQSYIDNRFSQFKDEMRTYYFHVLELGPTDRLTSRMKSKFPYGGNSLLRLEDVISGEPTVGTLVFGDAIYDLETYIDTSNFFWVAAGIPLPEKRRSFRVLGGLEHYSTFHLTSTEKQILENRHGSMCKDVDNVDPPFYSYKNCLQTCGNYYNKFTRRGFLAMLPATGFPGFRIFKIVKGEPCFFVAENLPNWLMDVDLPTRKPCSYYNMMKSFWSYLERFGTEDGSVKRGFSKLLPSTLDPSKLDYAHQVLYQLSSEDLITPELKACRRSCLQPCNRQYTSVKSIRAAANELDYLSIDITLYFSCFTFGRTLMEKETNNKIDGMSGTCRRLHKLMGNTLKEGSLSWQGVLCGNRSCINRFVIAIDSDSTLYKEIITFSWDTIFGIVGGQIGLVMGASCLTILQLIWVMFKTIRDLIGRSSKRKYNIITDIADLSNSHSGVPLLISARRKSQP